MLIIKHYISNFRLVWFILNFDAELNGGKNREFPIRIFEKLAKSCNLCQLSTFENFVTIGEYL